MTLNIIYSDGYNKDLSKLLKLSEDTLWKHFSLDDWDYVFIVDGKSNSKTKDFFNRFLLGCCSNEIHYIKEINKTIGIAYHS